MQQSPTAWLPPGVEELVKTMGGHEMAANLPGADGSMSAFLMCCYKVRGYLPLAANMLLMGFVAAHLIGCPWL
jgi:hypothetical protein